MDHPHKITTNPTPTAHESRGRHRRSLVKAITEMVDHGIIPARQQTEFLGQASVWLEQARQAATVLRGSRTAMINNGLGAGNLPWDWFLLHQDEQYRAGVMAVNPYRPVPAHNHPGASGILLMLEGHLIEHHYHLDQSREADTGMVRLQPGETRYLDEGQASVYLPDWNNLHSLAAMGRSAIVFSIQLNPGQEAARSWFLPVNEEPDGSLLAVRSHQGMLSNQAT